MMFAEKITEDSRDPVSLDTRIGETIRRRRLVLGLTQEKLGGLLKLTFQQIQKYERGQNRVSASRLYEIARILEVPVSHFFNERISKKGDDPEHLVSSRYRVSINSYSSHETSELLRNYFKIKNRKQRQSLLNLIRAIAEENAKNSP